MKNIRFVANSLISYIYRGNENVQEHLLTEELVILFYLYNK